MEPVVGCDGSCIPTRPSSMAVTVSTARKADRKRLAIREFRAAPDSPDTVTPTTLFPRSSLDFGSHYPTILKGALP